MIGKTAKIMFSAVWRSLKFAIQTLVRFLGTPFQRLFDKAGDTHRFLTEQAICILKNDGYTEAAEFFSKFKDNLVEGNLWADLLWKNAFHHYSPVTEKGLLFFSGGADQCGHWFNAALNQWRKGRVGKSMFMLGAACHIVQDLCQPYHANCRVFGGHQKYEQWADSNKNLFAVNEGGMYGAQNTPADWVVQNANFSFRHIKNISKPGDDPQKIASTETLLAGAQKSSAGFLMFFLQEAQSIGLPATPLLPDPEFFKRVLSPLAAD